MHVKANSVKKNLPPISHLSCNVNGAVYIAHMTVTNSAGNPVLNLHRDVDEFTRAYIVCALWTFDDDAPSGDYEASGRPEIVWTNLSDETLARMIADCVKFQIENAAALSGYPASDAGHDFWLTRNGHGCGFWENDFGTEEECELLTKASERFGEFSLYFGDDGKIYR